MRNGEQTQIVSGFLGTTPEQLPGPQQSSEHWLIQSSWLTISMHRQEKVRAKAMAHFVVSGPHHFSHVLVASRCLYSAVITWAPSPSAAERPLPCWLGTNKEKWPLSSSWECSLHFLGPSTHLRGAIRGLEWDGVSQATGRMLGRNPLPPTYTSFWKWERVFL